MNCTVKFEVNTQEAVQYQELEKCFVPAVKNDIETGTQGESTGREIKQLNAQVPCQKGAFQKYWLHQFSNIWQLFLFVS